MLAQAVSAYLSALEVFTREENPEVWALVQSNLGVALREQGVRTIGGGGMELLAQAVAACRSALEADLRQEFDLRKESPEQWGMLHNNLGVACQEQGFRTEGANGTDLLVQAAIAYRSALEVFTLEQFPECFAMLQNNLGIVLQEQARRTANAMGTELLAQAVVAYRNASTAFGREQRPRQWAMVNQHLGVALEEQALRVDDSKAQELSAQAVVSYRNALSVYTIKEFRSVVSPLFPSLFFGFAISLDSQCSHRPLLRCWRPRPDDSIVPRSFPLHLHKTDVLALILDSSRLILRSSVHPTIVMKNRKAAAKRVTRVPAISALKPQTTPPTVIAPWDRTIISALIRPRAEPGIAR